MVQTHAQRSSRACSAVGWLALSASFLIACEGDRPKCRPRMCVLDGPVGDGEADGDDDGEPEVMDDGDTAAPERDAGMCDVDLTVDDCPTCIEYPTRTQTVADDCTCGARQWACVTARGDTASGAPALYYSAALDHVFYFGEQGSAEGLVLCDSLPNPPPACACDFCR